ncbi:MAG: hypothetical protein OEW19_11685, partial [Acidobacteriota bacterium]|nr:hypothetical protein [Acidobacteriota bacterium]
MTAGLDMPAAPRESAALVPAAAFQAHGAAIVLVALAALGAETALLALSGELQPWMLLGGHGLVSLAVAGWVRAGRRQSSPHAALLAVVTTAFGPFGPAGVLLSLALGRHYARLATPMDEWHAMLFPPTRPDENAELWRRIGQRASDLSGEQHVTPFLDVLAFGSIPQRQSVIAIIAQQFHPSFAPALKAALCDPHNVIRVQAATAIARLENEFLERTMRLEAAAREAPDDPAAVLALAGHYDDQ